MPTTLDTSAHPVAPPTRLPALELLGVTKSFGDVRAVRGIDLRVEQGEVVAFLGPNGAGKTTTMDLMLGLGRPDTGTVRVLGRTPAQAIARGEISAVLQTGGLLKDLTVAETVRLTGSLFAAARPVAEILRRAGLVEIADRKVGACSGGQQQRLRFALALLPDPRLLLLDEPTAGMDVEARREFWSAIRADAGQGRTVIFATHYLEEADAYADRVVLVRAGEVVADGSAADIKNLASGRVVSAHLPAADAAALRALPGVTEVEVRGDRVLVQCTDSDTVARYLLTQTPATSLEVTARGLEEAFLTLTTGSTR